MVPRDLDDEGTGQVEWGCVLLLGVAEGRLNLALLQGAHSVGLMWWMLAREVLRMRGTISREHPWEVMPDLYSTEILRRLKRKSRQQLRRL